MSNALAISGVTAVLQYCLGLVYNSPSSALASVKVSALAPDLVQASLSSNTPLLVNLFMYQVTHNAAWRNSDMPSLGPDGGTRLKNSPLALDLHYLLTVYASEDTQAEALLGYAVLLLHENAILPRSEIRTALDHVPHANPLWMALTTTGLSEQIEMIKITPSSLSREETGWLWSAFKSDYRPSYSFQVSVVLMQPALPTSFALPILSRTIVANRGDLLTLPARLLAVQPPAGQTGSAPGDTVRINGSALSGTTNVSLMNQRLGLRYAPFAPTTVSDTSVSFVVPDDPANLPAGMYNVWLISQDSNGASSGTTNILPMAIAPLIVLPFGPGAVLANSDGTLITLTCRPEVLPSQSVSLALAGMAVSAVPFKASTSTLAFQFPALTAGSYIVQMRVDGVDSPLQVRWLPMPPVFEGPLLTV